MSNIGFVVVGYSRINRAPLYLGAGSTISQTKKDAYGVNTTFRKMEKLGHQMQEVTEDDEGTDAYDFCVRTIEERAEAAAEQDSLNNANC
jgi:hypothetical protein